MSTSWSVKILVAGTFSQPSICFGSSKQEAGAEVEEEDPDRPGPSGFVPPTPASRPTVDARSSVSTGAIERRRSLHTDVTNLPSDADDEEDQDVYSEALPGPSRTQARRSRGRASSSGMAGSVALSESEYGDLLAEQHRLSTSMGEVLIHEGRAQPGGSSAMSSRCVDSLESTQSLTYLEWVHEKQHRRMLSRSEWFLSPTPKRNNGGSRSFDFHQEFDRKTRVSTSSPSPSPIRHLELPVEDAEMRSSSDEMRSQSCTSSQSHSSSAKEQLPHSPLPPLTIVKSPVTTAATGETTPRLPFQLLQHHSGESDDAPLSATPPARHQPPVFFADDPVEPPAKTSKSSSSSSGNGNGSQSSVLVAPTTQSTTTPTAALARVSSIGVVRRKSFRTHYVRPNKSLDQEPPPKEDQAATSQSTPAASSRRSSANGGESVPTAETSRALIRRKSSGSSAQSKVPVQARRSTQI